MIYLWKYVFSRGMKIKLQNCKNEYCINKNIDTYAIV